MSPTLVLGACGSFGRAAVLELLARNCAVRVLVRDPAKAERLLPESVHLHILHGDAQDAAAVDRAANGCGSIIHGINYPYHEWDPHMITATDQVLRAARTHHATVLFPGNVYGLGRQTAAPLDETAHNQPISRKGALRVRLEDALRQAAHRGHIRALILRAGDFFGPTVRNLYMERTFGRAAAGQPILVLGNLEAPHQWAYVPDLARVAVDLLERRQKLPEFDVFHFAGYTAYHQRDFLRLIARVAGHPNLPIRNMPWWLLWTVNPFNPVTRELRELRYLFDESIRLHDGKLRRFLPHYQDTPIEEAVRVTLESYRQVSVQSA